VENLAVDKVDWNRVIHNSAFRKAPFNPGEKEKGFRDAVLAETFLQIVKDSPTTPRICRIALISADNLLSSSVLERTSTATNIRILKSLDELKSLINTLVSSVSEEVIGKIREQAELHFFAPKDEKTLYYTEKVGRSIQEKFGKELDEIPEGADRRENGSWFISAPGFLKKEGQRVTWVSSIEVEAKAFKYEKQSIISGGLFTPSGVLPISPRQTGGILGQISQPVLQGTTVGTLSGMGTTHWTIPAENLIREKMIAEGRTHFEVTWSHLLSTNLKFRSPRIDNTRFVKTAWETK
jgi:hypothetical protein